MMLDRRNCQLCNKYNLRFANNSYVFFALNTLLFRMYPKEK